VEVFPRSPLASFSIHLVTALGFCVSEVLTGGCALCPGRLVPLDILQILPILFMPSVSDLSMLLLTALEEAK
jgi:hypothetical protein